MKDQIGNRMKAFYEDRTRYALMRRTYTIIRIDGKAFHTYTRGLQKPFDDRLMDDMDTTAAYICQNIQGAKFAFVQSDEISVLITDFDDINTGAWFEGNLQKMCSVSASLATAKFNQLRPDKIALFDSRVFQMPNKVEVENYFIWRQQDTTRNSISSVAQSLYSHKELNGKSSDEKQELIFQKGINWNDYAPKYKRGRLIEKLAFEKNGTIRTKWTSIEVPVFTKEKEFLNNRIISNA